MVDSSFCVYIIFSEKLNGYYVGTTNDFSKRLKEHNDKAYEHSYTSKGAPWQPYLLIEALHSEQAYKIEKHIKNMKSTRYVMNLRCYPEMVLKLTARYE